MPYKCLTMPQQIGGEQESISHTRMGAMRLSLPLKEAKRVASGARALTSSSLLTSLEESVTTKSWAHGHLMSVIIALYF